MGSDEQNVFVGVDVGGTHSDALVLADGQMVRGKALTTYDDFSRGVLGAVEVAAGKLGYSTSELLGRTRLFVNGTTVVTNAITQLRGSRVGVMVTGGFGDTFRFAGGPRLAEFDDHVQVNAPDLVARDCIVGIDERIDYAGTVLQPIDRDQVREAARHLLEDQGVDVLAVCFLSSYVNGEHELAAEEAIHAAYPDVFVTLSHRAFAMAGENRRWTTAVLNSFVQAGAKVYLDTLEQALRDAGLSGGLAFFQGIGGGISVEKAREYPLGLLGSGPAGGAIGANELARRMGEKNVLIADMGGTSFDTGIIHDNRIHTDKNIAIGPFETGVNIVDVVSVGAGGGSIAWLSERGVPQVGPQSAGSTPGPAALGKGGEQPTVTDALVTMGFIDPQRYLEGRVTLRPELAERALERTFGEALDWSAEEAAAAIHDLVVVNMANAVREVTVEKGHDPRDFLFLSYGGMLPVFAAQIASRLGIPKVVVPSNSSVFCAAGLLASDFVLRYDQNVSWDLSRPDDVGRVNEIVDEMVENAHAAMSAEGFEDSDIEIGRGADIRFQGQSYELTLPIAAERLSSEDAERLSEEFLRLYERTYGVGTAWKGVPATLVNYSVTVTGRRPRPTVELAHRNGTEPDDMRLEMRSVYRPGAHRREEIPVYDDARFTAGASIEGPALIDAADTTIYVPSGFAAERDEYLNYVLTKEGDS
jgi:N-methylhydantoinase A